MSVVRGQRGFSLVELLVGVTVTVLVAAGLAGMLIHNARVNKAQQMTTELQGAARNSLALVVQKLRSAGWDPLNADITPLVLDPDDEDADHADGVDDLEIRADLSGDGALNEPDEQVRIRRSGDRILWRRAPDEPFMVLAANISNDADGDGNAEPMFVPDSAASPSRITVRITAQSSAPDPVSRRHLRYTVSSDVVLRGAM